MGRAGRRAARIPGTLRITITEYVPRRVRARAPTARRAARRRRPRHRGSRQHRLDGRRRECAARRRSPAGRWHVAHPPEAAGVVRHAAAASSRRAGRRDRRRATACRARARAAGERCASARSTISARRARPRSRCSIVSATTPFAYIDVCVPSSPVAGGVPVPDARAARAAEGRLLRYARLRYSLDTYHRLT